MSTQPAPESSQELEFAALIAIDWADQKHCWKLRVTGSGTTEQGQLLNTPEAIETWAAELNLRFEGRPLAVCLEQKRGVVVAQLSKYPYLVLYPVHPTTLARFRDAFFPSGSKGDPGDTALLLELLTHHRDRLRRLNPDTAETRLLQMLVEGRRKLVHEKTRCSNRLTALLKLHFPQALQWIDDIDSLMGCDLLQHWPTLAELQRVNPAKLTKFFHQHNCRSKQRIQERIDAIYLAQPATNDPALLAAGRLATVSLARMVKALLTSIAEFDRAIEQAMAAHPEAAIFDGLPGAGPALKPRLIAAFGTQRERYSSAGELQSYCGIAPVTKASGKSSSTHFRHACPKFLRQTFHEFAALSIRKSVWARLYYQHQRSKAKGHHAAVRALAFKWIRILFRCWQTRTPYHEPTYLLALQKHNSPLHKLVPTATPLQWETVGGFQKLSLKNP
ncbi:MAG TPA: IS110 family transposase [Nitrosospira sp.]|nr:IS110 family transposase [Nitrosospira sp.]